MRVLITGTSSGIGKAIAEKFLKEGFDVTGFDRKEASISQDSYTHFCLDIRDREQYPALAPFDIVINNAGVQNENDIDINLKGTIAITEAYEFPEYTASKGGVLAYTKNVALRIAPYGGTCNSLDFGGVLTELNLPVTEDQKLWDQIMDLTPLKRWMTVEETADWAYFMTVTNRFCTGQNILIDGLEAGNAHFVWPDE